MSVSKAWKWIDVCSAATGAVFDATLLTEVAASTASNPIDDYLASTRALIVVAGHVFVDGVSPQIVVARRSAGRLLILGLVSEVERYFRRTLVELAAFCPHCADKCADFKITFADLMKYGTNAITAGLLPATSSFASKFGVQEHTKRIAGMQVKSKSELEKCLSDFDQLCHLRHGAVHGGGILAVNNTTALGMDGAVRHSVVVDFIGFTKSVEVCHNLVRTYNLALYKHTIERWMDGGILSGDWAKDKYLFSKAYRLFRSDTDGVGPAKPHHAYASLRQMILQEQGIGK